VPEDAEDPLNTLNARKRLSLKPCQDRIPAGLAAEIFGSMLLRG
jgi:hypothetical protein